MIYLTAVFLSFMLAIMFNRVQAARAYAVVPVRK